MWNGLRLIDDSHHVQTSNSTGILSGLALSIIKVGRDSDHSMCNRLSQVSLCSFLHLSKHHGRDLLRGKGLQLTDSNLNLNMGLGLLLKNLELFK